MSDEIKKNEQPIEGDAADNLEIEDGAKKSGGFIRYLIFGASGLAVVTAIAFGVLFFLKDDPKNSEIDSAVEVVQAKTESDKSEQNTDDKIDKEIKVEESKTAEKAKKAEDEGSETTEQPDPVEMLLSEDDEKAIDKIMNNLAFLDYEPSKDELLTEDDKLSDEDSIVEVNWIEQEKARLSKRESDLNKREKDILKLEKEVNAKITRLEQAESNRINKLAKLYDGMDPRAVAQLMMNLDDETVVSIIPRMKSKNASAVLQLIPSKRAAKLSKQMITIAGN